MTKKLLITPENPEGILVDLTAEEVAQKETDVANAPVDAVTRIEAENVDKANGNQKFLDMGLTQAEATALTGYTPPVED